MIIHDQDSWFAQSYRPLYVEMVSGFTPGVRSTPRMTAQVQRPIIEQQISAYLANLSFQSEAKSDSSQPDSLLLTAVSPIHDPAVSYIPETPHSDLNITQFSAAGRKYGMPKIYFCEDLSQASSASDRNQLTSSVHGATKHV